MCVGQGEHRMWGAKEGDLPGNDLGARTLLGTSASLLVTSALLVVTRSY